MPELPEVQTIVCDLDESIKGFEIVDFYSFWKKNVDKGKFQNFKRKVLGKKITGVERRGKYILLLLDSGGAVVVHLRMSGQLIVENQKPRTKIQKKELEDSHVRHFWMLRKGRKEITLSFVDIRKFGTVDLLDDVKNISHKGLLRLGVEPLSKNFSPRCLEEICNKSPKRTIRQILLDQQMICGIGNIYASEILFDAKTSSLRKCGSLKKKEIRSLHASTGKILKKAIVRRGTTFSDYRDLSGKKGGFQKMLKVYNRERERCPRRGCEGIIKKEKLHGRSAFWCPKCQKR